MTSLSLGSEAVSDCWNVWSLLNCYGYGFHWLQSSFRLQNSFFLRLSNFLRLNSLRSCHRLSNHLVSYECARLSSLCQDCVLDHSLDLDKVLVWVLVCNTDNMGGMVPVCASTGHTKGGTMGHTKDRTTLSCTKVCTRHPTPSLVPMWW